MTNAIQFSWLTILLMLCGWASHWLITIRKAKKASIAVNTTPPRYIDYFMADKESFLLSVIGLVVGYFLMPWFATKWPDMAAFIGSTPENPVNPLAAYFLGLVAPMLADYAGNRLAKLVG